MSRPATAGVLGLALKGYGWLPDLRRRTGCPVVRTRVLGRRAVAMVGEEAARFFYDEEHVQRSGAIPGPVQSTLFGHGAVHTLDGVAHRARKAWFLGELSSDRLDRLVEQTAAAWDEAAADWQSRGRIGLHEEAARVLTVGVCRWAEISLASKDVGPLAADLVALVDGFATVGPRHWKARIARRRRERWISSLVQGIRDDRRDTSGGQVLSSVAQHRDADGERLDSRTAAVEVLNLLRPTVAVSWFVAFAADAIHRWPQHRERLSTGDDSFAVAFAQEVRRFYPFAPFVGGLAVRDLHWRGERIPAGTMVLLDLYGQNHDDGLWQDPYAFRPERFLGRSVGEYDLVPQGGGNPATNHRCPGDAATLALLTMLAQHLARLEWTMLDQQKSDIPLHRIPTLPASRVEIQVSAGA